jgi:hypothetical protein
MAAPASNNSPWAVIAWIAVAAARGGHTPAEFMINTLVEIDSDRLTTAQALP